MKILYLSDDLSRYFALFLSPVETNNPAQAERQAEQAAHDNEVLQTLDFKVSAGQAKGYVFKNAQKEAKCAVAQILRSDYQVTAVYCLMDHYSGEKDPQGGIRLFGSMYGIEYEPVEKLLEDFLAGLQLEF